MELKEAIERLKRLKYVFTSNIDDRDAIDTVLKELDKKDKVINLMAQDRAEISEPKVSKEAIIDFYFKKVEEENE